jgi:hypothetical protein
MLRRIFGPKTDEEKGEWRRLPNKEIGPIKLRIGTGGLLL